MSTKTKYALCVVGAVLAAACVAALMVSSSKGSAEKFQDAEDDKLLDECNQLAAADS